MTNTLYTPIPRESDIYHPAVPWLVGPWGHMVPAVSPRGAKPLRGKVTKRGLYSRDQQRASHRAVVLSAYADGTTIGRLGRDAILARAQVPRDLLRTVLACYPKPTLP